MLNFDFKKTVQNETRLGRCILCLKRTILFISLKFCTSYNSVLENETVLSLLLIIYYIQIIKVVEG